jgi:hypothetical protein
VRQKKKCNAESVGQIALANAFSVGSPFSVKPRVVSTLGVRQKKKCNAESVGQIALANAFSVGSLFSVEPRVEATLGWN